MALELDPKVRGAHDKLREKLIQTTLRNRMINYRSSEKAAVGLDIQRERSAQVWDALVVNRKRMGFTGPADPPKRASAEGQEAPEPPAENDTTDLLLYSPTPKTKRENRLKATARDAQIQIEERGVNTLFLALGMLEWRNAAEEIKTHRAPLILVPVTLERTAKGDFKVVYDEGEIGTNLSLQSKLAEQGLELPSLPSDLDQLNLTAYYQSVAEVVRGREGFAVHADEIALHFFSFEKIALYLDLDLAKWPEDQTPCHDPDIVAALGDGYPPIESVFSEETQLDEVRSVQEAREVFQADSSQLLVLEEAKRGTSMVVEGPPGTGKSQTIANLIAEFVSQGKRVLFVSEKAAAVDVVFRKLKEANLSDCAIDLHGAKVSRRKFFDEVKRTWQLRSRLPDETLRLERLSEVRQKLNRYVQELHSPLAPYGVSPRRLMVLAASLPKSDEADASSGYEGNSLKEATWTDIERARPMIADLQLRVTELGVPSEHPFWDSELEFFGPDERSELDRALGSLMDSGKELISEANELSLVLGVPNVDSLNDVATLYRCVETATASPLREGGGVAVGSWQTHELVVREVISALKKRREIMHRRASLVSPLAWDEDWSGVVSVVSDRADSFFGRLGGEYRRAIRRMSAVCQPPTTKFSPEEAKSLSVDLHQVQQQLATVAKHESLVQSLFGVQWKGRHSDPDHLEGVLEWVLKLEKGIASGALPPALANLFDGNLDASAMQREYADVRRVEPDFRAQLDKVVRLLRVEKLGLEKRAIADVLAKAQQWRDNLDRVRSIIGWKQLAREARENGLGEVVDLAEKWALAGERLENHVLWQWSRGAVRAAMFERPSLQSFERSSHEQLVSEFRRLDEEVLTHNRARVKHAHLSNLPEAGAIGGTAELYRQCDLKRGHKAIRWAVDKYGEILLKLKPVFMMSPLSVATYLPAQPGLFDVVIFDEASQVRPEEALSAIARAKQTIVVGDTKQMPPSNFFDSLAQDDETDEDVEYDSSIGKFESVLALWSGAVGSSVRRRDLRWHYRSLHDSLIRTSNRLFYEDRLVVFPSPVFEPKEAESDLGLRFHYDPNTTYDRGAAKKVNLLQAKAVAEAINDHMRHRSHESLLVVSFNKDQAIAIVDALEAIGEDDLLREFLEMHPHEPLKSRNLETVQGDERDVVFISVGYGRDSSGAISNNFGPVNRDGGERRLNVMMTRAKKRTEIFTSIRGADIRADDEKEGGVRALKTFLEYAESGQMNDARSLSDEADSEFEVQVRQALNARGYEVDGQVGTAGFRIDLAVRHPQRPGEYVLGIECDGATYHSAKSARDRDKLRQLVLESRGWRIHRIWSTDWWMNREAALERCVQEIVAAIDSPQKAEATVENEPLDEPAEIEVWTEDSGTRTVNGEPYEVWNEMILLGSTQLHELSWIVMGGYIRQIVDAEGPIHFDLLVTRLRMAAGLQRAGNRIRLAVGLGTSYAQTQGWLVQRGEFLYSLARPEILPRDRSQLPAAESAIEKIAPEEIDAGILKVLDAAHFASEEELFVGLRKLFGYGAMPSALADVVGDRLDELVELGKLRLVDDRYRR